MKSELLFNFEDYLYKEAERVRIEFLKEANNKGKINEFLNVFVKSVIKSELANYRLDIEFLVRRMLLQNENNIKKEMILNDIEILNIQNQLLKYCKWCKEETDKDHEQVAGKIALDLIKFCKCYPTSPKGLAELIYDYMPIYFKNHYDSIDSKVIMLFLTKELNSRGYLTVSLKPFRLISI